MTLWARLDDRATGPGGEPLYENRAAVVLKTRWGKVVEQEDYYVDTVRMAEFDRKLTALGVVSPAPAAR